MVEISNILKKKFAAVNKQEKKQPDNTVYGSVFVDSGGQVYVTMDGSEERTPATTTMEVFTGDRIIGEVKDHKLIITGNLTKPTDQTRPELEELEEVVDELSDDLDDLADEIEGLGGKYVVSMVPQWCLATARSLAEGETFEDIQAEDCDWEYEVPEMPDDADYYYWTRDEITYSNGDVEYSEPIFDSSTQLTYEAQKAADDATVAAEDAEAIASQKAATFVGNTTPVDPSEGDIWFKSASDPLQVYNGTTWVKMDEYTDDSTVDALMNHFWWDNAGAHVAENATNPLTTGASQTIASAGTIMRRDGKVVTSWTGGTGTSGSAALNFYDGRYTDSSVNLSKSILASYARSGVTFYSKPASNSGDSVGNVRSMSLTPSGMTFWDPSDTTNGGTANQRKEAEFSSSGVKLYSQGSKSAELTASSVSFYDSSGYTTASFGSSGCYLYYNNSPYLSVSSWTISGVTRVTMAVGDTSSYHQKIRDNYLHFCSGSRYIGRIYATSEQSTSGTIDRMYIYSGSGSIKLYTGGIEIDSRSMNGTEPVEIRGGDNQYIILTDDVIKFSNIDGGLTDTISVDSQKVKKETIYFNRTYKVAPHVVACCYSDPQGTSAHNFGSVSCNVHSVGLSSFVIVLCNNSSTDRNPRVSWVAIGSDGND